MLQFLRNIDRAAYRGYMTNNIVHLDTLITFLTTNFNPDFPFRNLRAKDDVDPVVIPTGDLSRRQHDALIERLTSRRFYNVTDLSVIIELVTLATILEKPDTGYIAAKLVTLQDLHSKVAEFDVQDNRAEVMAKLAYNRSRIFRILQGVEDDGDLLETGFGEDAVAVADDACRMNGAGHHLNGILETTLLLTSPSAQMITDICSAMLQYRAALLDPETAGFGEEKIVSEIELSEREAEPGAFRQLEHAIGKWENNPGLKPLDFLYAFQESIRVAGVDVLI